MGYRAVRLSRTFRLAGALRIAGRGLSPIMQGAVTDAAQADREAAEEPIRLAAGALIDDQVGEAEVAVQSADEPDDLTIDDLHDENRWIGETVAIMGVLTLDVLRRGYQAGAVRVGSDAAFDRDTFVNDAIRRSSANLTTFPGAVRGQIAAALRAGLRAGESRSEIARRVRDVAPSMKPWKARQIARTTGGGAYTAGEHSAFERAGIQRKRWGSGSSGNPREHHDAMVGETVGMGERFSNGLRFPRDPWGPVSEIANCSHGLEAVIE